MYPVFRDEAINARFLRFGFSVHPLLSSVEIERLRRAWDVLPDKPTAPFSFGFMSGSVSSKQRVHELVCETLGPRLHPLMNDYEPLFGQYVLKRATANSGFTVHQDWCFADETRFITANIWVPLTDVNEDNGALYVLPGSQLHRTIRGPGIPSPCEAILDLPFDGFRCIKLRAGEAILFDSALLHRSRPNVTAADRVAVSLIMIPSVAEPTVTGSANGQPGSVVDVHRIDSSFFVEKGLDPACFPKVGTTPYLPNRLTASMLSGSA